MKLQVFVGTNILETDIDPSQRNHWDDKLEAAAMGNGQIIRIGSSSVHSLKISFWRFVDDSQPILNT